MLEGFDHGHRPRPFTRVVHSYPLLPVLLDARRTVKIHDDLRKKIKKDGKQVDVITMIDPKDIGGYFSPVDQGSVNVVAMATCKLSSPRNLQDQIALRVIYDLFNTFAAGFTLARELAREHLKSRVVRVNTGPIGTGDFNNNIYLVYILQVLAARYAGVDEIYLFGYDDPKGQDSEKLLGKLEQKFADEQDKDKTVLNLLNLIPGLGIRFDK